MAVGSGAPGVKSCAIAAAAADLACDLIGKG